MSEQNKPTLWQKLKDNRINRSAVITVLILMVAVAIIVSVTVANNRTKKDQLPDETQAPKETTQEEKPSETKKPVTQAPTETEKPTGNGATNVQDKLPSFILPVSGALSQKHDVEVQSYSPTMNDYRTHAGVDIVTETGAPVYAAADGKITKIWEDTLMGYCMAVAHSGDCYTIYKNLSATLPEGIKEGVTVRSGQLIASVGESAMVEIAEEPHLHFEMTVGDLLVDPLKYYDEKTLEALSIDASFGE